MNYEIGDIILMRSIPRENKKWYYNLFTKMQNFFDGKASHSEIICEYNAQTKTVKTLGVNTDGLKFRHWNVEDINIAIVRVNGMNSKKAEYVLNIMKNDIGQKYSYEGLIFNASINTVMDKIFPKLWKKKTIIKDERIRFCSEFVGEFIKRTMNKKLSRKNEKNIHNNVLTPSDIYKSYDVTILKDFGV